MTASTRPIRVCRIDGRWTVLDASGNLRRTLWSPTLGIVTTAVSKLPMCCWPCAMELADVLAAGHRRVTQAKTAHEQQALPDAVLRRLELEHTVHAAEVAS